MHDDDSIVLVVDDSAIGQRLDRFVTDAVADMTRSTVQRLIEQGHITRNDKPTRAAEPLKRGDQISVQVPEAVDTTLVPEEIPLNVVYVDDDIIVVDKPAGMVVHPAPGHPRGTLVNALLWHYPGMNIGGGIRPGIVHRIDRDTSGLLVIARNDYALQQLQQQQLAHTMHKEYIALVEGGFKTDSGTVDAAIARHPRDRLRMAIMDDGRPARTHWRVIERFQQQTVLALTLETGRTHQIRVHCQHMRHPIIGDPMYGVQISKPRLERQFLHAQKLGFLHPRSQEAVEFNSPLPSDLQRILDFYRMKNAQTW
ncbi:MAG: RluA family pseudouridine synthase [Chloroflexales bacterium]|nr:RluA family pseudouridine synthase [Chloroflexales bacterium]